MSCCETEKSDCCAPSGSQEVHFIRHRPLEVEFIVSVR